MTIFPDMIVGAVTLLVLEIFIFKCLQSLKKKRVEKLLFGELDEKGHVMSEDFSVRLFVDIEWLELFLCELEDQGRIEKTGTISTIRDRSILNSWAYNYCITLPA